MVIGVESFFFPPFFQDFHHDLVLSGDDECTGGACLLKAHKTASCTHWERYLHHNKQYEYLIDV